MRRESQIRPGIFNYEAIDGSNVSVAQSAGVNQDAIAIYNTSRNGNNDMFKLYRKRLQRGLINESATFCGVIVNKIHLPKYKIDDVEINIGNNCDSKLILLITRNDRSCTAIQISRDSAQRSLGQEIYSLSLSNICAEEFRSINIRSASLLIGTSGMWKLRNGETIGPDREIVLGPEGIGERNRHRAAAPAQHRISDLKIRFDSDHEFMIGGKRPTNFSEVMAFISHIQGGAESVTVGHIPLIERGKIKINESIIAVASEGKEIPYSRNKGASASSELVRSCVKYKSKPIHGLEVGKQQEWLYSLTYNNSKEEAAKVEQEVVENHTPFEKSVKIPKRVSFSENEKNDGEGSNSFLQRLGIVSRRRAVSEGEVVENQARVSQKVRPHSAPNVRTIIPIGRSLSQRLSTGIKPDNSAVR